MRESFQFSDERIAELRFANKPLNEPMKWIYKEFAESWTDKPDCKTYGDLKDHKDTIRNYVKKHFDGLKEKQIKDLLDKKTWQGQKQILLKAKQLQQAIGKEQHDDMNQFDDMLKAACDKQNIKLDASEKKQITSAVSWKNPQAEKVIRRSSASMPPRHTTARDGGSVKNAGSNILPGHPDHKKNSLEIYGIYKIDGKYVEYKADGDLRDFENVALDPSKSVNEINEAYFQKEVQPHVPDAWIDASKTDSKDGEIGIVGYEIPFNRHFYVYQPPRDLAEIDADLDEVSGEIMALLQEVHS